MKSLFLTTAGILSVLSFLPSLEAADPEAPSEFFETTKLVYEDDFDGPLNEEFWEVRQSSTWVIKDGILTGSESSKEFQEKMIAKGDKAHAGFKPVIWLKQVPENFVCTMRVRYNAEAYHPKFPLFDVGHHIHTLVFGEALTSLYIKKDVEIQKVEEQFLPLNQWVDVTIELKKGKLLLKVDDRRHVFESGEIDMTGHGQIDFKGVDFGSCQIDRIQVWEGL
tara:strand:- start:1065 stop:1730 length:666 start_codon:yes stop_codon:yes gene_type:complete